MSCIQSCLCFLSLLPVLSSRLPVANCVLLCVSAFLFRFYVNNDFDKITMFDLYLSQLFVERLMY